MEIFYLDTNNFSKQTIEEIVRIFPSGSNLEKRRVEFALGRFLVSVAARNFYNLEDEDSVSFEYDLENEELE